MRSGVAGGWEDGVGWREVGGRAVMIPLISDSGSWTKEPEPTPEWNRLHLKRAGAGITSNKFQNHTPIILRSRFQARNQNSSTSHSYLQEMPSNTL